MGVKRWVVEVGEADRATVGGVVAKPEYRTCAGDTGADRTGQRGRREYPCAGGTRATGGCQIEGKFCAIYLGK
jgi:hypothetical protein